MQKQTVHAKVQDPARSTETRPPVRAGETVARAVALIGGASLVIGGALGYAFGYLDGLRQKGVHDDI
jgi:hypothetical protein